MLHRKPIALPLSCLLCGRVMAMRARCHVRMDYAEEGLPNGIYVYEICEQCDEPAMPFEKITAALIDRKKQLTAVKLN